MEETRIHNFRLSLGMSIRTHRETQSLSLRQFGAMVGLSYPFLSNIETGKASPTVDSLVRIADGLGITVSELLEFEKAANVEYDTSDQR